MLAAISSATCALVGSEDHATLVPPFMLNCVVTIGIAASAVLNGVLVGPPVWHTIGTGFFYGHLIKADPDPAKRIYDCFLVTAKHVINDYQKARDDYRRFQPPSDPALPIKIRVNPLSATSVGKEFDLLGELADPGTVWVDNPVGKDVTVVGVNLNLLTQKYAYAFFTDDTMCLDIDKLKSQDVSAGDGVFVLGFPMDLAGLQKNYVIISNCSPPAPRSS
jgi:hypothetical protein